MHRLLFGAVFVRTPRSQFLLRSDRFLSSSLGLELARWKKNDACARFLLETVVESTIVDAGHCHKTQCGRFTKISTDKKINVIFRSTHKRGKPIRWASDDLTPFLDPKKGIDHKLVSEYLKDAKDKEWRFCTIVEKDHCPPYYVKTKIIKEGETEVHVMDDYGYISVLDKHGSPNYVHAKLTFKEVNQTLTEAGLKHDISHVAHEIMLKRWILLGIIRKIVGILLGRLREEEKMYILKTIVGIARVCGNRPF